MSTPFYLAREYTPNYFAQQCGSPHPNREDVRQECLETLQANQATTLLIKELPRKYTEEDLVLEVQPFVSAHQYNFVFLPWHRKRPSNIGYAFLNCIDAPTARFLQKCLDGNPWRFSTSRRAINVVPAHVQGIALNLAHHMDNVAVREGLARSPMVLYNGQRISFQEAVSIYCPPEMLSRHLKDSARPEHSAGEAQEQEHLQSQRASRRLNTGLINYGGWDEERMDIPSHSSRLPSSEGSQESALPEHSSGEVQERGGHFQAQRASRRLNTGLINYGGWDEERMDILSHSSRLPYSESSQESALPEHTSGKVQEREHLQAQHASRRLNTGLINYGGRDEERMDILSHSSRLPYSESLQDFTDRESCPGSFLRQMSTQSSLGSCEWRETPHCQTLWRQAAAPRTRSKLSISKADGSEEAFSPPDGRQLGRQAANTSTGSELSTSDRDGSQESQSTRSPGFAPVPASEHIAAWESLNQQLRARAALPEQRQDGKVHMTRFSC